MKHTAQLATKRGAPCLESCIHQLIITVNQLTTCEKSDAEPLKTQLTINTTNGTNSTYRYFCQLPTIIIIIIYYQLI